MDILDLIADGKIRRYFKTKNKLNSPGLISHLTQRSAGREPLFIEKDDYLFMLASFKDIADRYSLNVFALCLMPNHIHFLLSPTEANLRDAMRDLFSIYAGRFNRKYERRGHLVGGPYRQAVCLDDSYLLAASLYIHLNPVNAGLSKTVDGYRWSSSRLYCRDETLPAFVDPSFVLNILSPDTSQAKERYRVLLQNGKGLKTEHVLEQEDAIERFRRRVVALFPKFFQQINRANQTASRMGIDLLSMDVLENRIEEIREGTFPSRPESREAKRFIIQQMVARGFPKSEIAHRLGISRKTVYNLLRSDQSIAQA